MQTTKSVCIFLLPLLLAAACGPKKESPDDKLPIEVKVTETGKNGGWEYDIYVDHKLFIKQDRIPAVQGAKGFATKADAEKTSKLVVERIKKGMTPALSEDDLKGLGIQLPAGQ